MTSLRTKRHYLISDNNCEYVIVIETVSTVGVVIKLMFILSEKVHLERFYRDLKDEILIDLLDTRYVNDELSYTYIQHFEHQSRRTRIGVHRILLCNGYKNHLT